MRLNNEPGCEASQIPQGTESKAQVETTKTPTERQEEEKIKQ